ncbi:MAG TPA: serine/threonine-protein kinase [Polyangiaceae bacterium]|jgi:serine/threonine-protein kinase
MAQQQQRYKVIEKIASGGMAEVFRAESAGLEGFKKTVAIKRVLPHLSERKQFIGMFLDEARLSAHLSHSNCVQVFDIGVGDNTYFIVMEYVDGADLKAIVEHRKSTGQPFPVEEAVLICVRLCEGLSYAHELADGKGENLHIVHRDMSPPNVLITRNGEVKIVDFGLAKANSQLERSEPGIIKGKFSYLSPEAAQGLPIDARTDIFAVGIILWELLAGRRLFLGETDLETVRMVQATRVPPITSINGRVSPQLEKVVSRALAADTTQRYQSARELCTDLNKVLFSLGRPVSSYDIARLVEPLWVEHKRKRRDRVDRGALIGTLIDEALIEFTSLQPGNGESKPKGDASAPLNLGSFENSQDWSQDLGGAKYDDGLDPVEAPRYELGGLASLEEEEARSRRRSQSLSRPPADSVSIRNDSETSVPSKSGGKRGVIAVIVLLLVLAGMAGAYFSGIVPKALINRLIH